MEISFCCDASVRASCRAFKATTSCIFLTTRSRHSFGPNSLFDKALAVVTELDEAREGRDE